MQKCLAGFWSQWSLRRDETQHNFEKRIHSFHYKSAFSWEDSGPRILPDSKGLQRNILPRFCCVWWQKCKIPVRAYFRHIFFHWKGNQEGIKSLLLVITSDAQPVLLLRSKIKTPYSYRIFKDMMSFRASAYWVFNVSYLDCWKQPCYFSAPDADLT